MKSEEIVAQILGYADVKIGGNRDWDIQVHDKRFYDRVLQNPSLGLGESYMNGWWDCKELDTFFFKILKADLPRRLKKDLKFLFRIIKNHLINKQTKSKAKEVGEIHYDIGNDLYEKMLDKRMVYTCGYWKDVDNLDKAQEAKLDLVCRKVGLKPGMKVLDIGCGWGSFLKYAAENYGIEGIGITISKEQAELAKERTKDLNIEIRFQDYRDVDEKFDTVVSLGMFEHVGPKNYRNYMKSVEKNLKDDGLFLLHTIGNNFTRLEQLDPWIEKYIFPNGVLPSQTQIMESTEKLFVLEDWHNFGVDYGKTCRSWYENLTKNWDNLNDKYDNRFYRMWKYFLLSSSGAFNARKMQLWQVVFSKKGVEGGYTSIR